MQVALDYTYLRHSMVLQTNPTVSEWYAMAVKTIHGSLLSKEGSLSYKRWLHHQGFLCFQFQDMRPIEETGYYESLVQNYDRLSIHLSLTEAALETQHLIIFAVFDNCLKLSDKTGVKLNYVPGALS